MRLPGKGNPKCYGARPVHQIITMIKWIQNIRLSIRYSHMPIGLARRREAEQHLVQGSGFRVRVQGSGCRVQGSGMRVQGSGLRVEG